MALMIPDGIGPNTPSSERKVFQHLKTDQLTENWTVFHSLALAQRGLKKPYGEIDFVILIPDVGVMCLEVKGGGIACEAGTWSTIDRHGRKNVLSKSPFVQVRDGMHALRDYCVTTCPSEFAAVICFTTCVVFPDTPAPPQDISFKKDEVLGADAMISDFSAKLLAHAKSQICRFGWKSLPGNSRSNLNIVQRILRPDFEIKETYSTRISQDRHALITLTQDQYNFLDSFRDNRKCLVKGAAGTGKTMLATELVKQFGAENGKSAFLCYNRNLGRVIKGNLSLQPAGQTLAGSLHEIMHQAVQRSGLISEFDDACDGAEKKLIYERILPEFACRAVINGGYPQVDFLVADEAQDLMRKEYIDFFDIWLEGGIRHGKWAFFGDFSGQAIYSSSGELGCGVDYFDDRSGSYTNVKLNVNCRNTRRIASTTYLISGFNKLPCRLNQIEGIEVDFSFSESSAQAAEKVERLIRRLLSDGIAHKDIVILSKYKFKNSETALLIAQRIDIHQLGEDNIFSVPEGRVVFSTVHSFKGLESTVVILIDVDDFSSEQAQSLLYTGMSRAITFLSVHAYAGVKKDYDTALTRNVRMIL